MLIGDLVFTADTSEAWQIKINAKSYRGEGEKNEEVSSHLENKLKKGAEIQLWKESICGEDAQPPTQ